MSPPPTSFSYLDSDAEVGVGSRGSRRAWSAVWKRGVQSGASCAIARPRAFRARQSSRGSLEARGPIARVFDGQPCRDRARHPRPVPSAVIGRLIAGLSSPGAVGVAAAVEELARTSRGSGGCDTRPGLLGQHRGNLTRTSERLTARRAQAVSRGRLLDAPPNVASERPRRARQCSQRRDDGAPVPSPAGWLAHDPQTERPGSSVASANGCGGSDRRRYARSCLPSMRAVALAGRAGTPRERGPCPHPPSRRTTRCGPAGRARHRA
jgi:hypothetical protein